MPRCLLMPTYQVFFATKIHGLFCIVALRQPPQSRYLLRPGPKPAYLPIAFFAGSRQGEDFHRMLTIARLTALSLGDEAMTAEHWSHMKDLEARVAGRVRKLAVRATNGSNSNGGAGVAPAATVSAAAGGATPISPSSHAGPLNAIPENE